jgi:hypothetical protein
MSGQRLRVARLEAQTKQNAPADVQAGAELLLIKLDRLRATADPALQPASPEELEAVMAQVQALFVGRGVA